MEPNIQQAQAMQRVAQTTTQANILNFTQQTAKISQAKYPLNLGQLGLRFVIGMCDRGWYLVTKGTDNVLVFEKLSLISSM